MASAEERREARRRKILENSENRMQKVLGESNSSDVGLINKPIEIPPTHDVKSSIETDFIQATAVLQPPLIDDQQATVTENNAVPRILRDRKGSPTVKIQNKSPETVHNSVDHVPVKKNVNSSKSKASADQLLKLLELIRLGSMILLAFVARWILSFGFGIFYIQSIFAPFIATELAIYAFQHMNMQGLVLPHKGSMLSSALMLCGIKPHLITVYNEMMGYMTAVTEDCATYLFTFFLCNIFMSVPVVVEMQL